jgi:hypothetical protein
LNAWNFKVSLCINFDFFTSALWDEEEDECFFEMRFDLLAVAPPRSEAAAELLCDCCESVLDEDDELAYSVALLFWD